MSAPDRLSLPSADASYAPLLHAVIAANRAEGRLLPRAPGEIAVPAEHFVAALNARTIVWCSEPSITPADVVSS